MPILFSSSGALAAGEKVLWVDDYVSRADAGILTPTSESFGFRTYIPSTAKALLSLDPAEYLAAFRDQLAKLACNEAPQAPTKLEGPAKEEAELLVRKALGMANPGVTQTPTISDTIIDTNIDAKVNTGVGTKIDTKIDAKVNAGVDTKIDTKVVTKVNTEVDTKIDSAIDTYPILDHANPKIRKSAALFKIAMAKLRSRPVPFQYIWAVHHEKGTSSPSTNISPATFTDRLTTLAPSVPNIGEFYKIFNNVPWSTVKSRDSMHIFRAGVKPLWEDPENIDGGSWTLKVRRQPQHGKQQSDEENDSRIKRVWEEICLLGCGGELQGALEEAGGQDHVLGMSFSPKLYWVCISIWLKKGGMGDGAASGGMLVQKTVLERLSPELRPTSEAEYYYRKHSDHDGWEEAVGRKVE